MRVWAYPCLVLALISSLASAATLRVSTQPLGEERALNLGEWQSWGAAQLLIDILPGLKAGDSYGAQARH